MVRLWSEWDFGESNLIFASKQSGMNWLSNHEEIAQLAAQEATSLDNWIAECFDQGYFSWEEVQIVE
jgi:hypothetical protein